MENKLKLELDAMPAPKTTFEELEANVKLPQRFRPRRKTIVLMAAVLIMLLCGAGWAKMQYGMWYLIGSKAYSDLENAAAKYDLVLPDTLDGTPFYEYNIYGLVPQGAPYVVALTNPAYKPRTVTYGWRVRETETYPSGELCSESTWTETDMSLHFGTTENELWRYYFQFDEKGVWTDCEVPESYEVIEYKGITLQVGDTFFYDSMMGCNRYTRWVHWVDEEKQVVFSLSESDYTDPKRVVECAKAIIDLNS